MQLTDILGIELPIIQSPMAGVQGSELAAAVSNAGGLGSLPSASLSLEALKAELTALTSATDRPFNVNFFCHTPPVPDPERESAWRKELSPYYQEFHIDPESTINSAPWTPITADAADFLEAFKPAVVSFHYGLPAPEILAWIKGWGGKVQSSATTVAEAVWLEQHGADLVIAQGLEAGGHRGMFLTDDITTQAGILSLLPRVLDSVAVPVIAAGGIASAGTVKALMDLGASGVQVGTSFLLCPEANTSAVHRLALQGPDAGHTVLTNVFSGRPARSIVNRFIREAGPISDKTPAFPLAGSALAPMRTQAENAGSGEFSALWSGQNNSGCKEIPAAEMTRQLAALVSQ